MFHLKFKIMSNFSEFDEHGRYIESSCYGCNCECEECPLVLDFKECGVE